jgi:hypothetical protein
LPRAGLALGDILLLQVCRYAFALFFSHHEKNVADELGPEQPHYLRSIQSVNLRSLLPKSRADVQFCPQAKNNLA